MGTYTGTSGNDTITGSTSDDTIDGLDGDDTLSGDLGADTINGGNGADTLNGDGGADTLNGGDGADTLNGGADNDSLTGGTGADIMSGGTGNDTYYVDNVFDSIVELSGEGTTDAVHASVNYVLSANVERLTLTGSAVSGTGNASNNVLIGNSNDNYLFGDNGSDTLQGWAGNDTLYGGSDSSVDVLDGGTGDDIMYGGQGIDFYYVDSVNDAAVEYAGEGTGDTIRAWIDYTLTETDNMEGIQLQGTANLNGTGNSVTNEMSGNSGDNVLSGLAGNDDITAGDGSDTITGGVGNDLLRGGSGADLFIMLNESADVGEVDLIYDLVFGDGDRIDLSAMDANTTVGGDQAFTFVGAFSYTAGEATIAYDAGTNRTEIRTDVDGDAIWDYLLRLSGNLTSTHESTGPTDGGWIL